MHPVLIILIILVVLYLWSRMRHAFDKAKAREVLSQDATRVRNSSGRVAYGVTAASTSRLSRLQARLEQFAAQQEQQ